MSETQDKLNGHLKAMALRYQDGLRDFSEALRTDPVLKQAAIAETRRITEDVARRCYISRRTRQHLMKALQGV